jgi:hypothetical protein|eukprot:SAG25_NODE_1374_length_3176_cov_1.855704_4_plen_92_part_00
MNPDADEAEQVRGVQARADFSARKHAPLQLVCMLGGPGSGARTISGLLAETFGLGRVSITALLRRAIRRGIPQAEDIRVGMQDGHLVRADV